MTWTDAHNAELYDHYARHYSLYRDTSRDLVGLVDWNQVERIMDLACGTGITTEAILASAAPTAQIVGLDGSEAMLELARRNTPDPRVRWVCSPAAELAQHASSLDAVVCNSAIWQLDMLATFAAAAQALAPGGRMIFNIGQQMLGVAPHEPPPSRPTFQHLVEAIAVLEYDFVPQRRRGLALLTLERIQTLLAQAGLVLEQTETFTYSNPPEDTLAWISVPIFAQQALPGMPYPQQLEAFRKAYERWDKSSDNKRAWLAFVARKP